MGSHQSSDSIQSRSAPAHHLSVVTRQTCSDFEQTILDSMVAQIAVLDCTGVIVAVNAAWRNFAILNGAKPGYTAIGENYLDVFQAAPGNFSNEVAQAGDGILAVLEGRLPSFSLDYPCHSPTEQRWFSMVATPLPISSRGVVITHTNITARRQAEERLRIAAIAFESRQGIVIADANGIILGINNAFTTQTGYTLSDVEGKTPALFKSGRHDHAFYQHMRQSLKEQHYWEGEIWNLRKNGKIRAEWLSVSVVTLADGRLSHYVSSYSNITERSDDASAEIHRLAYYDPLTNLPNRRLLHDRLGQALAAATRSGRYGAILFLNLDGFKKINDTRGHACGDAMLAEIAQRLCRCVHADDTVARWSGDEFVLVLENLGSGAEETAINAEAIGERLRSAIAEPFDHIGIGFQQSASVGIALFHEHDVVEELLMHGDLGKR